MRRRARSGADVLSGSPQRPVINLSASDGEYRRIRRLAAGPATSSTRTRDRRSISIARPRAIASRRRSFSRTTSAVSSRVSASQRRSTTARASEGSRSASEKSGMPARFVVRRGRSARRLSRDVDRRCADQAVAADEVVIEKRQRLVGRQRREPQRQARQLHRRRIQVDAEEASLRDEPPEQRAIHFVDIRLRRPGRREPAPARTRARDIGMPRRERRRCPSPDPRREAEECDRPARRRPADAACAGRRSR